MDGTLGAFEVYIGGFGGSAYGVWSEGKELVYESFLTGYENREQLRVTPSTAQWRRFWRTMDRIDVWAWRSRYEPGARFEPPGVIRDGTYWSLSLGHGEQLVESSGDGAAPGSIDLDRSAPFASLLRAVSRLVGGCPFE